MRIKIPVVMTSDRQWCASHDSHASEPDWSAMEDSAWAEGGAAMESDRYWVVVDVPVPDPPSEIEGEVEV